VNDVNFIKRLLKKKNVPILVPRELLQTMYKGKFIPGRIANISIIEKNLLDTKKVLDEIEVKFWLGFGTLLGVFREGRIMPWDEDADLIIFNEDRIKVFENRQKFADLGFKMGYMNYEITLYRDGEHIDLVCFQKVDNVCGFLKWTYSMRHFIIHNHVWFLGECWRIPSFTELFLERTFKDWKVPMINKNKEHLLDGKWKKCLNKDS